MAAMSRAYNGSDVATLTGGTVAGTVGGETLNFSGQTGRFNDKNVGTGKAVTVAGLTLTDGTGLASNYSVTQPAGLTADITDSGNAFVCTTNWMARQVNSCNADAVFGRAAQELAASRAALRGVGTAHSAMTPLFSIDPTLLGPHEGRK